MARETRGSAAAEAATENTAMSKRKRQASSSTDGPRPISLKVTLPAQAPTASGGPRVRLTVSPTKVAEQDASNGGPAKRQRISLKVKGGKQGKKATNDEPNGVQEADGEAENGMIEEDEGEEEGDVTTEMEEVKEEQVEVQKTVVRLLSKDVRDALGVVLARMAVNLPRPLNEILTLFLPPSFEKIPANTLGFILQQEDLSWERLVDALHIFTTHLLQPCAYPSPFPPLSHIHTSIPPLPSHQPPHVIYDFCLALRDLVLSVEPTGPSSDVLAKVEKWGLMMRVPGGTEGRGAGDWWTGIADWREMERIKAGEKGEGEEGVGVLERLAAAGDKFGFASAVSVASFAGTSSGLATAPKLGDSLIRKASLKAARWKEQLARRKGGFGSVQRPVAIPRTTTLPWTPSFASTFDSNYAAGGVGYWSTLEAMHQRNRYRPWTEAVVMGRKGVEEGKEGYHGTLEVEEKSEERLDESGIGAVVAEGSKAEKAVNERQVGDVLRDNAEWLHELLGWQEVRVRRGEQDVGAREQILAEELLNSLSTLTSTLPPSSLRGLQPGFAHTFSRRLIHTPGPIIRGTLDPRRSRAIHDTTTIRPRPSSSMPPIPTPGSVSHTPSIAQQLAGTPNRSTGANGGGGYTPTPASGYGQSSSMRPNYGYNQAQLANTSASGSGSRAYPSSQQLLGQSAAGYTPTPPQPSRSTYTHTPLLPGSTQPSGSTTGNTIYSRPVMMSPSLSGGSPLPSPPAVGLAAYGARPGMMPSGLRQSFGPEAGVGTGNGVPAVQGQGQGHFAGAKG